MFDMLNVYNGTCLLLLYNYAEARQLLACYYVDSENYCLSPHSSSANKRSY